MAHACPPVSTAQAPQQAHRKIAQCILVAAHRRGACAFTGHTRGGRAGVSTQTVAAQLPRTRAAAVSSNGAASSLATPDSQDASSLPSTSGRQQAAHVLPPPPALRGRLPRKHWNALALAYLGDSIWEMYARRHYFSPPRSMTAYHASVKASVRAEAQDAVYRRLTKDPFLSLEELEVLRWGRNATGTVPKRFAAAGLKTQTYRHATAVECLAGFLYLTDPQRLHQLMAFLDLDGSELVRSSSSSSDSSSNDEAGGPDAEDEA